MAVLVLNDSVSGLVEAATYCKAGDEKRPVLVGLPDFTTTTLCPEDPNETQPMAEDASPDTFYVRIMFDELLDPSIEDLIPILDENGLETGSFTGTLANTQPVNLKCTGVDGQLHDLPYDGYYSPSGNAVTWPVGPSLVIKQTGDFIVPTNSLCEVTIKDNVLDKQGNQVPADQRGPFKFKVSGIKALVIDPSDDSEVDATAIYGDNFYMQTNAEIGTIGANGLGPTSWCTPVSTATPFAGCASDIDFAITPEPRLCAAAFTACLTNTDCPDTNLCVNNGNGGLDCEITGNPASVADDCATDADCIPNTCEPGGLYVYSLFPFGLTRAEWGFGPFGYPETEKEYTFEIKEGSMVTDRCGAVTTFGAPSVDKNTKVTVTTKKFDLRSTSPFVPANNDTVPANRKIKVFFSAPIDPSTVDPASFTVSPQPFLNATTPITNAQMISTTGGVENDLFLVGHYQPNTDYTFTMKSGAVVKDHYGKTYTFPEDKVIKFKTQAIAITASSPANGATVTKATPTSVTSISFTFNQGMDQTTFTTDDIELTGTATTLTFTVGASPNTCSAGSPGCQLRIQGVFAPGDYTLKLKKDAVIKDRLGNDYIQAADRVIKFTVKEATPAPVIPCLGA